MNFSDAAARYGVVEAPGKLVLLGEYAVVDDGPAIVAAVDRGVRCRVRPGRGCSTPGDDRFVRAALDGAPAAHYTFEDVRPVHGIAGKPGFGGSAAATVAAVIASAMAFGTVSPSRKGWCTVSQPSYPSARKASIIAAASRAERSDTGT